ncbi:DUF2304 domain-containing protein [Spirosoma sp. BT702]|uniref:DUF2304 domain-containing protein n=1 Tax=Spirosoma profusum TaxID=2771354 RepID=A0A927AMG8_9BACT|nr:DUF2304 domain-containing protein [Spirosoma profusum]MBD2699764.1 DUF2304 domain-containing protein [Spirosoma profusum]
MTADIQFTLTPIQLLLSALLLVVAVASLRLFRNRLLYRLFFIGIVFTGILFVAVPILPVYLATKLGVGRGVDLVFYLLFTGFLLLIAVLYRRLLQHDTMLTQIIRQNAIKHHRSPGTVKKTEV